MKKLLIVMLFIATLQFASTTANADNATAGAFREAYINRDVEIEKDVLKRTETEKKKREWADKYAPAQQPPALDYDRTPSAELTPYEQEQLRLHQEQINLQRMAITAQVYSDMADRRAAAWDKFSDTLKQSRERYNQRPKRYHGTIRSTVIGPGHPEQNYELNMQETE